MANITMHALIMGLTSTAKTEFQFEEKHIQYIQKNLSSPFRFRLALMGRLPMGFLSGMKVRELTHERCKVELRYKWLNKNPFRSMFWAVLGMAAEMSSGAMIMMYTYKQNPSIATLVARQEGVFHKKAIGKITFTCESGKDIAAAVEETALTGEGVEIRCPMKGVDESGEVVAEFAFTWSVKARQKK